MMSVQQTESGDWEKLDLSPVTLDRIQSSILMHVGIKMFRPEGRESVAKKEVWMQRYNAKYNQLD